MTDDDISEEPEKKYILLTAEPDFWKEPEENYIGFILLCIIVGATILLGLAL